MSPCSCVIGIAGSTCSGKSALARELVHHFRDRRPALITCDSYYRDLSHLALPERERQNFDIPDAIEHSLLYGNLKALMEGREIEKPQYDFVTHSRTVHGVRIAPSEMIVVEGLFLLHWADIRRILNVKVFVTLPDEVVILRRIERDVRERGRTEQSVLDQYHRTVRPMYEKYVFPSQVFADILVNGTDPVDKSLHDIIMRLPRLGMSMS